MRRALILDLDNTLYDFDTYYAKSVRAMVHALARTMEVAETTLMHEVRDVLTEHGSLEYAFVIQELASVRRREPSEDELTDLIRIGSGAFRRLRAKYLQPYPGVRETLKWGQEEGLLIVGLSDAPSFAAEGRLRNLRLDGYFDELHSWAGYDLPEEASARPYKPKIKVRVTHGPELRKPNPQALRAIVDRHSLGADSAFLVGDRLTRDIELANLAGVVSIWARYGTVMSDKTICVLQELIPWELESRQRELEAVGTIIPTHVIDSFEEIREIVSVQQRLF